MGTSLIMLAECEQVRELNHSSLSLALSLTWDGLVHLDVAKLFFILTFFEDYECLILEMGTFSGNQSCELREEFMNA